MAVMVTGGAGYIGSHMVAELLERGEEVVVVDNLLTGYRQAVLGGKLYVGDLRDADFLETVFQENEIDSVIHFAASSLVGESMKVPAKYYRNNVYGTLCLLEKMQEHGVNKIVFSSTAATYGEPDHVPISEDDRTQPTNTYGETKLAMEKMMKWFDTAHGVKYVALRYFNAAG
uniref:NAD-dependent epimerase/dehydratase family protein n=1 Tax=Gorillibacterium massiliense TaxID=1280390 RepID=UPI000592EE14